MHWILSFLILILASCHSLPPSPFTSIDRSRLERNYPQTLKNIDKRRPLSVEDIKNLTRSGIEDATILHVINVTHSVFYLSQEEEQELREGGVSQKVIAYMKKTSEEREHLL